MKRFSKPGQNNKKISKELYYQNKLKLFQNNLKEQLACSERNRRYNKIKKKTFISKISHGG